VRLVSAGIPLATAQRVSLSAALALVAALAFATPSLAATPDVLGALPAQVAQPVGNVAATVAPAAPAVPAAAESVRHTVEAAVPPAPRVAGERAEGASPGATPAPVAADPAAADQVAADPVAAVDRTTGQLSRGAPAQPPTGALPPALGDALRAVGDTLRGLMPAGAPIPPLFGGAGLTRLTEAVLGGLVPTHTLDTAAPVVRLPSPASDGLLAAGAGQGAPPMARRAVLESFQSASAQPPAAEAGGRPGSPSPRKAPVPAGGTAAPAPSGGFFFAPFLALLVLAALAAPTLLRRLEVAPAFLRPALFVCALERPG
jgi:hypothetical protein